jgi:hypothetical protein
MIDVCISSFLSSLFVSFVLLVTCQYGVVHIILRWDLIFCLTTSDSGKRTAAIKLTGCEKWITGGGYRPNLQGNLIDPKSETWMQMPDESGICDV